MSYELEEQVLEVFIDEEMFNSVYIPYLYDMTPTQILFGGSSSGKSAFYAQKVVLDIAQGGRNYLICRQVQNTIFTSIRNEIVKAIKALGLEDEFHIPKSDFTITCTANGSQILFAGLDDVEKLKSITPAVGVITDIGVEEATECERGDIKQLEKRLRGGSEDTPKRITLLFNPILQHHWIYTDYFATLAWTDDQTEIHLPLISIQKTTYKDNKFLTKQDIERLENETDAYYYNVYTLGNWGTLGNIVFTNWKVADLNNPNDPYYLPIEQRTVHRNGGDFGFGGNPAAIEVTHYSKDRKRIYIFDELYETGLTNDILADRTIKLIGNQRIIWDSAEPKSIKELVNYHVNAFGAKKGPDSIKFGIQWLQQQEIIVDVKCINNRKELSGLKWKEDRRTGIVLDETVGPDHLLDGLRYAYEDDMIERPKGRSYEG